MIALTSHRKIPLEYHAYHVGSEVRQRRQSLLRQNYLRRSIHHGDSDPNQHGRPLLQWQRYAQSRKLTSAFLINSHKFHITNQNCSPNEVEKR